MLGRPQGTHCKSGCGLTPWYLKHENYYYLLDCMAILVKKNTVGMYNICTCLYNTHAHACTHMHVHTHVWLKCEGRVTWMRHVTVMRCDCNEGNALSFGYRIHCYEGLQSSFLAWIISYTSFKNWSAMHCSFIHSFVLNIYIAPLQENYSEALPTPARLKIAVCVS